jgi:hypothetical protein
MTKQDLENLATYRTHKKCQCLSCQEARKILAETDRRIAK